MCQQLGLKTEEFVLHVLWDCCWFVFFVCWLEFDLLSPYAWHILGTEYEINICCFIKRFKIPGVVGPHMNVLFA